MVIDTTSIDTSMVKMEEMMNKMFTNDIKIDIDTLLFPQTYEDASKAMVENSAKGMNMKIKINETLLINNKTATHISGSTVNEGKIQKTEIYIIKENENQTIMITGVFYEATSAKYIGAAKKAAYSAKIDNK